MLIVSFLSQAFPKDIKNYDPSDSAWPGKLDEFAEVIRENLVRKEKAQSFAQVFDRRHFGGRLKRDNRADWQNRGLKKEREKNTQSLFHSFVQFVFQW